MPDFVFRVKVLLYVIVIFRSATCISICTSILVRYVFPLLKMFSRDSALAKLRFLDVCTSVSLHHVLAHKRMYL